MAVIKESIKAGRMIFERIIGKREQVKGGDRAPKQHPTTEAVQRYNEHCAIRNLSIKLHANFCPGDYHLVLTWAEVYPAAETKKKLTAFMNAMRREHVKQGREFKWVMVTEWANVRVHHHLIMQAGLDLADIQRLWRHGHVKAGYLYDSGDFRGLASYLIKETAKTFRNPGSPYRLRYSCSRNLVIPERHITRVSAEEIIKEPEPESGYYIDRDSIYRGHNPITHRVYIEYVMIAQNPDKTKSWWKKRKRRPYKDEHYCLWLKKHGDRQEEIDWWSYMDE